MRASSLGFFRKCERGAFKSTFMLYMDYNRYKIPPNFEQVLLHHQAALSYDIRSQYTTRCPCCNRAKGSNMISIFSSTKRLMKISEQLPLFFSFTKVISLLLIIYMAILSGEYLFSTNIEHVNVNLIIPNVGKRTILIGYIQHDRTIRFILFLIFALMVLIARCILKMNKYVIEEAIDKISNKSIILTNVPKQATIQHIRNLFSDGQIENIVFTYKIQLFSDYLKQLYSLKKKLYVQNQMMDQRNQKNVQHIHTKVINIKMKMLQIKQDIKNDQNRLDIAFVTFNTPLLKMKALQRYDCGPFSKLLYKCCTCCSPSAIQGQHITIKEAPDPEDIDWLNLQADYYIKKIHRATCYFICALIIIFCIIFQYQIGNFQLHNFYLQIGKSIVVFVVNFFIIMLLEHTTYQIEKHEYNTNKVLSLIRKLTFFVFINLSMSPLSIFIYNKISEGPSKQRININELAFSIALISICNILKPFAQYFNIQRVKRFFGFYWQRSKKIKSELTQIEANKQFQPIQFPIASFYSLLISSFFLTCFFLSVFQLLIIIELISCIFLYIIAKYMLTKVCKQPIGLSTQISKLSQKLLSIGIYIYWIGEKVMYYFLDNPLNKTVHDYIFTYDIFNIVEISVIIFFIFASPKFLSIISHKIVIGQQYTQSFLIQANLNVNRMTYEEVNSVKHIQQEYERFFEIYK